MKTYVCYHGACYDGFGSAYSAWKELGDSAEYISIEYGVGFPEFDSGSKIYFLDFCPPKDYLIKLGENNRVIVLDHHHSAEQNMAGLPRLHDSNSHLTENPGAPNGVQVRFDMSKSGAMMAWEYFNGGIRFMPELISYVQDRDLWKFELKNSREVSAALRSYQFDFEIWDKLQINDLAIDGITILRYDEIMVEKICDYSTIIEHDGNKIAFVCATSYWSEVGQFLLEKHPEVDYAMSFIIKPSSDQVMFSLRSITDFDVSEVAGKFGGGGHKKAAGFNLKINSNEFDYFMALVPK